MTTIAARTSAPPTRNGNGAENLPEHRQKMVEAANIAHQQLLAERDDLDRRLHEAQKHIEAQEVQLNALKSVVNMMESSYKSSQLNMEGQIAKYQGQRDDAVARAASIETTLANIYVMLRNTIAEPDGATDHVGEVN
jgi:chromosome segregation ATPase